MTTSPDSLTPEHQEQIKAFEELFWKGGEAVSVHGPSWYEISLAAWLMAGASSQRWHSVAVDGLPASGVPVIASLVNPLGNRRCIRAQYAASKTLEVGDDADTEFGEWDEETEKVYCPPGWYETNEYEETHWAVSGAVTHWMPLPRFPR